jgi:hypothetical protein
LRLKFVALNCCTLLSSYRKFTATPTGLNTYDRDDTFAALRRQIKERTSFKSPSAPLRGRFFAAESFAFLMGDLSRL